jgi:Putative zinc-finger
VNCVAVRDRLTERALGAASGDDGPSIERHLAWCAACRKEAGELERAAATFAFVLAPAEPPAEIEDRVVQGVRSAAVRRSPLPRRGRLAVGLAVAAMLAVSGLGWGAVMAGRAERFKETAQQAKEQTATALANFARLISNPEFSQPGNQVFMGALGTPRGGTAGGSALTLASPTTPDIAIVMVNGLRGPGTPLHVFLISDRGRMLAIGRIASLDSGGNAILERQFDIDLSPFTGIEVRDKDGTVVLRGSVSPRSSSPTPSP